MKNLKLFTILFIILFSSVLFSGCNSQKESMQVEKWEVYEIKLNGPASGNPYMEVDFAATFVLNDNKITVPGFYDGNGIYRIRFSPGSEGEWLYQTKSNVESLSGKKGSFNCIPATGKNHEPLKMVNTFQNSADDSTEVRWWAKGGELVGESPERIAFFKTIMEEAQVNEMKPELYDNGNPENLNNNIYVFSKPGTYYLAYTADTNQTVEINLTGEYNCKMDVIDTWNMQIIEENTVEPGIIKYKTTLPFTALRIYRNNE